MIFSYSVQWLPSTTTWAHRFDRYSNSQFIEETRRIHWFSILNSLLVLLFLSGMVAFIVVRTVFQDFARYNRVGSRSLSLSSAPHRRERGAGHRR